MFLEILIAILFWGIIIAIIVVRKKRQKEEFKTVLKSHIMGFSMRDDYFSNIYYKVFMERFGVQRASVDKILRDLPTRKKQFALACDELIALSDHNICLFSKEKCQEHDIDITNERLTRDTIEVLPALGKYFKEYNTLHRDIFEELLTKEFVFHINDRAFGIAFSKESDYVSKEDYDKSMRAFARTIDNFFQDEIRNVIKKFLELGPYVDIEHSTSKKVKSLLALAEEYSEQEGLFTKFLDIWVSKMQAIGRKYGEPQLDLYHYFNEIETKMQQHIKEYSIHTMFWLNAWAPRLDEHTEEECLRVLKLYTSGSMHGVYYGRHLSPKCKTGYNQSFCT